ncbi:phospholipase D-like domain-containing protein [Sphingomicrobium astaxanthinifaciens]|uniref:phospholipase D-like domain-containing protein n=1 Tax=Sphingomicrobium astaxanthinifaciens TaxID=1227949 RepID=UPI001FCC93CB|nr:phospholipase D-like domain-containing protein [Sphingomicrobium astaxanthinifaciens]MCJ7421547.1 phospholipase D-like domain-containing protein [Sphingomicrobium astaxanthinifaciens]
MAEEIKCASEAAHIPGRNCWKVASAEKVRLIIDAQDFFQDLKTALLSAKRQILLIGWDFDTRISLDGPSGTESLGELISEIVRNNPSLRIYILKWNFAAIKLLARRGMVADLLKWMWHPRIKVKFDSAHPYGASHHQKLIVVDGNLAFCGGIDVTGGRWDTRKHEDDVKVRRTPDGEQYEPWHDVSMAIYGKAAEVLGELAYDRWERAGAKPITPINDLSDWPFDGAVTASDVNVAIARTRGEHRDAPEIREIETLFTDLIIQAKRYIYIETQYFASRKITSAIAQRLTQSDSPEIVVIMPESAEGWLEQVVMDTARAKFVTKLKSYDRYGKFNIFHPYTAQGAAIYVHAKVMIVDDVVLRVGSANINNRSMGFDSECDCLIDARSAGGEELKNTINRIRNSLLAEHLGQSEEAVGAALADASMLEVIDRFRGDGKTLKPYTVEETSEIADFVASEDLLDPTGEPDEQAESINRPPHWWKRS